MLVYQCRRADVPEGTSATSACFLELLLRDKESILLCAESPDEMKWEVLSVILIRMSDCLVFSTSAQVPANTSWCILVAAVFVGGVGVYNPIHITFKLYEM